MGTYEKQYEIEWLNLNPVKKELVVKYNIYAILDDKDKVNIGDTTVKLENVAYDELFNNPIIVDKIETTMGEYLSYLATSAAKVKDTNFPIAEDQVNKFGSKGVDLIKQSLQKMVENQKINNS